jgi:hypothetical protein
LTILPRDSTILFLVGETESRIQNPESRRQNPEFRIQETESRIQETESRIQNPEFRRQNPEFRRQNPEFRRQNPESRIQNSGDRIQNSESRIQKARQRRRTIVAWGNRPRFKKIIGSTLKALFNRQKSVGSRQKLLEPCGRGSLEDPFSRQCQTPSWRQGGSPRMAGRRRRRRKPIGR